MNKIILNFFIVIATVIVFIFPSCSKEEKEYKEILPSSITQDINIVSPLAGLEVTTSTITLKWKGNNFDSYQLYFGENQSSLKIIAKNLKTTTFTIKDLENNKIYYWQVKGLKAGIVTGISPYGMIRVHLWDPAGNIIIISPVGENSASSNSITFLWHATGSNNTYTLYLGQSPYSLEKIASHLSKEQFTYNKLNDTTYYWKVEATDPSGNTVSSPITRFDLNLHSRTFKDVHLIKAIQEQLGGCAVDSEGTVWCWGTNNNGNLGIGFASTDKQLFNPVKVKLPEYKKFIKVATSNQVNCAISDDGELWCWGNNEGWGIGAGKASHFYYPVRIDHPEHKKWVDVAPSATHTCAIDEDGKLWCWGKYALGILITNDSSHPYPTQDSYKWVNIQANKYGICGLTADHEILCMGNQYDPSMKKNIGVLGFGRDLKESIIPRAITTYGNSTRWKQFSLGLQVACAIDEMNQLYCWGANLFISIGNGNKSYDYIQYTPARIGDPDIHWEAVATGVFSNCAITTGKNIYCWGKGRMDNEENSLYSNAGTLLNYNAPEYASVPLSSPVSAKNWKILELGTIGGCAITNQNQLYCWGLNFSGELPENSLYYGSQMISLPGLLQHPNQKKWRDIVVTDDGTYAIDKDGKMWWVGIGYQRIDGLGLRYNTPLKYDFPTWLNLYPIENTLGTRWEKVAKPEVLETTTWIAHVKHYYHSCAIDVNGKLFCWGDNNSGELGNGTTSSNITSYPIPITDIRGFPQEDTAQTITNTRWIDVAVGNFPDNTSSSGFTCAIDDNNDMWCWGANGNGVSPFYGFIGVALDQGEFHFPYPMKIEKPAIKWKDVEATFFRACALSIEGKLYCWGNLLAPDYPDEVTTFPTLLSSTSNLTFNSISLSKTHTCGITIDGNLYCWGFNIGYQLGIGKEEVFDNNGNLVYFPPTKVENPIGLKWTQVSVDEGSTCAVDEENNLWCWGKTGDLTEIQDQLGLTDHYFSSKLIPGYSIDKYVSVPYYIDLNGKKIKKVSVGFDRICALTTEGNVYCWGGSSNIFTFPNGIGTKVIIYPMLQTW